MRVLLDTDEGRFRAQTVGRFRFDRFDETSDVTVYVGQAIYEARNTALPVLTAQHAQFWIDGAGVPQYATVAPQRDAFWSWNDERDRAVDDRGDLEALGGVLGAEHARREQRGGRERDHERHELEALAQAVGDGTVALAWVELGEQRAVVRVEHRVEGLTQDREHREPEQEAHALQRGRRGEERDHAGHEHRRAHEQPRPTPAEPERVHSGAAWSAFVRSADLDEAVLRAAIHAIQGPFDGTEVR